MPTRTAVADRCSTADARMRSFRSSRVTCVDTASEKPASGRGAPEVSVVIAVFNGTATLGAQLRALETQVSAPSFEVLVMDNNSSDNVRALVARYPALEAKVVPAKRHQGQCYSRNLGVLSARGRHILICDQDDVVSPRWVRALHDELSQRPALATGPIDVTLLNSPGAARAYSGGSNGDSLRPYAVQGYLPFAYGCNLGIRRDDYIRLGGMDNSYRGGDEDTDFSWRAQEAGLPLVCLDDAVVHYRLRTTAQALFRQRRGYGRTRVLTWVRSRTRGRTLSGMSLRWSVQQLVLVPVRWLCARRSPEELLAWAIFSGAVVGNLEGQLLYRVLRRVPAPQLLDAAQ